MGQRRQVNVQRDEREGRTVMGGTGGSVRYMDGDTVTSGRRWAIPVFVYIRRDGDCVPRFTAVWKR